MRWKIARWILAGLVLLISSWLMTSALKMDGMGAALPVMMSVLLFVTFVLLLAPDTAFKLAELFAKPFAELFYPSDEFEKPPLSYVLARRYAQERRWDDALSEYEKILLYYPNERDAYLELIEVAQRMEDDELREKYEDLFQEHFDEGLCRPVNLASDRDIDP